LDDIYNTIVLRQTQVRYNLPTETLKYAAPTAITIAKLAQMENQRSLDKRNQEQKKVRRWSRRERNQRASGWVAQDERSSWSLSEIPNTMKKWWTGEEDARDNWLEEDMKSAEETEESDTEVKVTVLKQKLSQKVQTDENEMHEVNMDEDKVNGRRGNEAEDLTDNAAGADEEVAEVQSGTSHALFEKKENQDEVMGKSQKKLRRISMVNPETSKSSSGAKMISTKQRKLNFSENQGK
jgi:hypothetical protein